MAGTNANMVDSGQARERASESFSLQASTPSLIAQPAYPAILRGATTVPCSTLVVPREHNVADESHSAGVFPLRLPILCIANPWSRAIRVRL